MTQQPKSVRVNLDDTTMDCILDDLTERAGLPRNTSALNLARWDMKAVLLRHGYGYEPYPARSLVQRVESTGLDPKEEEDG